MADNFDSRYSWPMSHESHEKIMNDAIPDFDTDMFFESFCESLESENEAFKIKVDGIILEECHIATQRQVSESDLNPTKRAHFSISDSPPEDTSTTFQERIAIHGLLKPATKVAYAVDERVRALLSLPYHISAAFNSADFGRLGRLITDFFEEDCEFNSNALDQPLKGRHHVVDYHKALLESCPDATKFCKNTILVGNEVRSDVFFVGHHMFDHPGDKFFDVLGKSTTHATEAAAADYKMFRSQGKRYELFGKGTHSYFFNDKFKIDKVVYVRFVHELRHAVDVDEEK